MGVYGHLVAPFMWFQNHVLPLHNVFKSISWTKPFTLNKRIDQIHHFTTTDQIYHRYRLLVLCNNGFGYKKAPCIGVVISILFHYFLEWHDIYCVHMIFILFVRVHACLFVRGPEREREGERERGEGRLDPIGPRTNRP